MSPTTIGIPVFPGVDLLDVTVPLEVLGIGDGLRVVTIAPTPGSSVVRAEPDLPFVTHVGRETAPPLDVLLLPGGPGLTAVLADRDLRCWPRDLAEGAQWAGSICAGALWLAAAGLLDDHRATTHWASLDLLRKFRGVTVADGYPSFVFDRDRFTSGGVSTAFDASLTLRGLLLGEPSGKDTELILQCAPAPPFGTGTPDKADSETLGRVTDQLAEMIRDRGRILDRIVGGRPCADG